ncbi:MAG: methyltransferase domain-containing protein [Symploca sp. SIO2G7]|nr:methyltransferase domain-containing protein [Symploca sp. SIO2G7]
MSDHIYDISFNYWNSAVLRASVKLGLFNLLEGQTLSAQEIAQQLETNPSFTQSFLKTCVILGLIKQEKEQYKNTEETSEFLVLGKPKYIGDHILHITNCWYTWGNLDQLIRDGRTEPPFETSFVDADTYWTDYMKGQHSRATAGQGAYLVEHVNLKGKGKLLDLGGGAGSYSMALCSANPQLQAFVIDQAEPLAIARPLVEEQNLTDQITLVTGDFNTIDLETDYDVVLISGVVCTKSEAECRYLFQRAYNALIPGGLIIVQDFMQIGRSSQQQFLDIMMDLYLKIAFNPGASDRLGDEVQSWLTDVGFINPQQIPLPTQFALIIADKP